MGYVLITGASSGIGSELAKVFAKEGHDLILTARNRDALEALAGQIRTEAGVRIHVITQDLAQPDAAEHIYNEIRSLSLEVDILVNNAGFGYAGPFHEAEAAADCAMIQVNITALTQLTKLFAGEMARRGYGGILNVASTGSYHPGPYTAVYYATKAYVLSFSEAIAKELAPFGVTVTSVCPGATRTNFASRAGRENARWAMDPHKVARIAYQALMSRKRVVVPGLANKLFLLLPRRLVSGLVARYQTKLRKAPK